MSAARLNGSVVEDAARASLKASGRQVPHRPEIAPEMPTAEPPIAETDAELRRSSCIVPPVEEKRQR